MMREIAYNHANFWARLQLYSNQWDGLLLNLNYCPFFGQYGDGELLVFKLGEAHGPDYSSRC